MLCLCTKCNTYTLEYLGFIHKNTKHYRCLKTDCGHQEFIVIPSLEERLDDLTRRVDLLEEKEKGAI